MRKYFTVISMSLLFLYRCPGVNGWFDADPYLRYLVHVMEGAWGQFQYVILSG